MKTQTLLLQKNIMTNISAVILVKNEEKNIKNCIKGLIKLDEIIVVDDDSTDDTIKRIKSFRNKKIKIFYRSLNCNFAKQRNFAMEKAENDWVLFVDSDETVSEKLLSEILRIVKNNTDTNGYYIKRLDYAWEKKLKYGEAGNIKLIRLGMKSRGLWKGKVHEKWIIKGKIGVLENEIIHCPHQTVREFIKEINEYSNLRARELHESRYSSNVLSIIFYPFTKFTLNYFIKLGFLDGVPGLVYALIMSFHSFLSRSKLYLYDKKK